MKKFNRENSLHAELVEWGEDLENRFEKEWDAYVKFKLHTLQVELGRLSRTEVPTPSTNELVARRAEFYNSLNRDQRVSELINNFCFYLPGGWYRKTGDNSGFPEHDLIFKALDLVIKEKKIEKAVADIAASPRTTSAQKKIILELFLTMREKGFDIKKLRA